MTIRIPITIMVDTTISKPLLKVRVVRPTGPGPFGGCGIRGGSRPRRGSRAQFSTPKTRLAGTHRVIKRVDRFRVLDNIVSFGTSRGYPAIHTPLRSERSGPPYLANSF